MKPIDRRSRASGVRVRLSTADAEHLDPSGGPYVTICCDHGTIANHRTYSTAARFLPYPGNWCEACAAALHKKERDT